MTEEERRELMHAIGEIIDSFMDETRSFVLVTFPAEMPEPGSRLVFDVISSNQDRSYVGDVLEHVVKGIDQAEELGGEPASRPN